MEEKKSNRKNKLPKNVNFYYKKNSKWKETSPQSKGNKEEELQKERGRTAKRKNNI